MPSISLVTPTGGRRECFALCEKMISQQTMWKKKNTQWEWLVVDDTIPETEVNVGTRLVGPVIWKPEINTQRSNMDYVLSKVKGDYIFIIEDDDYYAPNYIEVMCSLLKNASLAGIGNARYYNVSFGGHTTMRNAAHASLSQTAFKQELMPLMLRAVNSGQFYFDVELWGYAKERNLPMSLLYNTNISIGMKGMPGRSGLTRSHNDSKGFMFDPGSRKLKEWIPQDWKLYEPYLKKNRNERRDNASIST